MVFKVIIINICLCKNYLHTYLLFLVVILVDGIFVHIKNAEADLSESHSISMYQHRVFMLGLIHTFGHLQTMNAITAFLYSISLELAQSTGIPI